MRLVAIALLWFAVPALAGKSTCAPDAVRVGPVCVDRYEESVWRIPTTDPKLLKKIQQGKMTLAELTAAGATQLSAMPATSCLDVSYGDGFPNSGNWTEPLYAVSVAGVRPSTCITWFQAEQACRLAGKRLITNQEWQAAAQGTPDPGEADDQSTTCATLNPSLGVPTGSRAACVSVWGANDMVGNAWEWTADWMPVATSCTPWPAGLGIDGDFLCIGQQSGGVTPTGAGVRRVRGRRVDDRAGVRRTGFRRVEETSVVPGVPAGIIRGGNFGIGARGGVFAIHGGVPVYTRSRSTGFRCAR
jgi:hypothetical protein